MDTRRRTGGALVFACVTALGTIVGAHHSQTGFDPDAAPMELKGTVAEYRWRNPHVLIFWDVKDNDGKAERWVAEFASVSTSLSRGMTKNTFVAGEEITITCIRARAGGPVCAQIKKIVKADGTLVNAATD
jgi:hypothetical protein